MFRNNVGPKDRVYRAVAAIILVSAYFSAGNWAWNGVALFAGLYLLFTAMLSSCAIYSVTGRNTNQDEEETEASPEAEV
jgi:DUF2892 family protein